MSWRWNLRRPEAVPKQRWRQLQQYVNKLCHRHATDGRLHAEWLQNRWAFMMHLLTLPRCLECGTYPHLVDSAAGYAPGNLEFR